MGYWDPVLSQSLAFKRFLGAHTQNNDFYWHTILTRVLACKHLASIDGSQVVSEHETLGLHPESSRFPHTFNQWKSLVSDHENWTRLNTLVASTGYLEGYVYDVTILALLSDPGVLLGGPRTVNGIHYLKNNLSIPGLDKVVEGFTKGEWSQRVALMKKFFGIGSRLDALLVDLDEMRRLRNLVAHRFGRQFIENHEELVKPLAPIERLSEERLKSYLAIIATFARTIDDILSRVMSEITRYYCSGTHGTRIVSACLRLDGPIRRDCIML